MRIKVGGVLHVVGRVHDVVFLMLCVGRWEESGGWCELGHV